MPDKDNLEEALSRLSGEKFDEKLDTFLEEGISPGWYRKILFDVGFNSQASVEKYMGVIVWHHIQWKKLNS